MLAAQISVLLVSHFNCIIYVNKPTTFFWTVFFCCAFPILSSKPVAYMSMCFSFSYISGQEVGIQKGSADVTQHFPHSNKEVISESFAESKIPTILVPEPQRKGLQRIFTSLRQRNYRLYWSGQLVSLMGTMMQVTGQTWLVLEVTRSAWQVGLVGALQALPILLFSIFGGVFADRWPKRQVLLITQSAAMLQALLLWLLLVTGTMQLWHLYVMVLVLGLTNSLGRPASRAFIVELVGREDLPNAIALNSSLSTLARIVGPALGGIIVAVSGVTTLFLLNALSFIPVLIGLALIKSHELHTHTPQQKNMAVPQKTWQSLREGIDYIKKTPMVLLVILVVGLVLLFG